MLMIMIMNVVANLEQCPVLDGPNLYYMIYERPLNDYDIPKGRGA